MKILIVGDPRGHDDEGMKRVNKHLKNELNTLGCQSTIDNGFSIGTNFLSWDKIVFTAGPTRNTVYKTAMLRGLNPKAEFIFCGLMPSIPAKYSIILRHCVDKVISENPKMKKLAELNSIPIVHQSAATFSFKNFLRGRFTEKKQISNQPLRILHVGHLNKKRNVFELAALCKRLNCSLTFLISSTEKEEKEERRLLESLGVNIINEFQNDLYNFYQGFDLYAFPVKRPDAAISMPLSIIEALLSGLNVLTTDFGEVSNYFCNSKSVKIVNDFQKLTAQQLYELASAPAIDINELKRFDSFNLAKAVISPL